MASITPDFRGVWRESMYCSAVTALTRQDWKRQKMDRVYCRFMAEKTIDHHNETHCRLRYCLLFCPPAANRADVNRRCTFPPDEM